MGDRFLRFWFPFLLYSGIIFFISSLPAGGALPGPPWLDKIFHMGEFMPFGGLLARAFCGTIWPLPKGRLWRWVLLGTLLYALSDEFHQAFVPARDPSLADAFMDTAGGCVGGGLYLYARGMLKPA